MNALREVRAQDRLSEKVGQMYIRGQYNKAAAKLNYNAAALEKMRHNLMREVEKAGLSGYVPEDVTYYPSNFHEVK